ncbi:TolC family protein [Agarivorans sp. QJM3NY_33]|uniref:TolC family protein n=1 Tax=Agarivorans sp. QJM3NY_33 TaxID=3421432 RepID=UPI003D7EF878
MLRLLWIWPILASTVLFGCSLKASPPQQAPQVANSHWSSHYRQGTFADHHFEQALPAPLQNLLKEAFQNNPNLQQSGYALDQQLYQIQIQQAQQWPNIEAFISGQRSGTDAASNAQFKLGLNFNWEIDWLAKLDARQQAAILDAKVSFEQWQQAQISLAATTAKQWYSLIEAQMQLALVNQRYENLGANLQIIQENYQSGLNSALDVYLARADLSAAQVQQNNRQQQLLKAQRQLELLLGRYPSGSIKVQGELAEALPAMPAGLPSELLLRRHDLKAAQYQLAAADLRVYAAYRDRFPSLKLTASGGSQSPQLQQLVNGESLIWSLFAGLTAPIFDAGQRKNIQLQQYAKAQALNQSYLEKILNSFAEVENSLSLEPSLYQSAQLLAAAAEDSMQAETLAFEGYLAGLNEYVTVLESQRRAFDARSSAISALNSQLQNRIELYLALGGDLNHSQTRRQTFSSDDLR